MLQCWGRSSLPVAVLVRTVLSGNEIIIYNKKPFKWIVDTVEIAPVFAFCLEANLGVVLLVRCVS